ncbi:chloride channel protein [Marinimicrobium sp. C6131]|uniref:chloride channel protein n=1 Tax=Marinimicrobium sp. C6131 TaxID=3022676 RepID=UPI00223D35FB|nr:chloride channel protein [Marinimicrobium sp. C6131]UZJ44587.1 chloride channel protein [Marinimicrobium sp. C6131]
MPTEPPPIERLRQRRRQAAERWRNRLAHVDALPQLTLLGLASGLFAGSVIIGFRLLVEGSLGHLLPGHGENFEGLPALFRFLIPLGGALGLLVLLYAVKPPSRPTGVGHVLDRLHNHQGYLSFRNAGVQFVGGALALLSGHSAGREGPAVHLGAASASKLGQWLHLPNNSLRPLVACGVAAAIAASFNTPMAGVIFAMEVVLMEYTIAGFIPVILAAVAGTTLTQLVFGPDIVFMDGQRLTGHLSELPIMAAMGVIIALAAAGYIKLHSGCVRHTRLWPLWLRIPLAGFIAGLGGLWVPEVMGMGYDTIDGALTGALIGPSLALMLIAKLLVTALVLGLGVPGGVIGPTLVMGACLGGAAGYFAALLPFTVSEPGVYAIVGMSAMMAAVINAPLAAIIAILELTYNPGILFPGMLVVVVASLSTRWLFRCDGLFATLLEQEGKSNRPKLMQQLLSRTGVRSLMHRRFSQAPRELTRSQARELLKLKPEWIILQDKNLLIEPASLAQHLEALEADTDTAPPPEDAEAGEYLDLLAIPARRVEMIAISPRANLYEAWQALNQSQVDALYIPAPGGGIAGLVTRDQLESYYRL